MSASNQRRAHAEQRRRAFIRVLVALASAVGTMHPSLYILAGAHSGDLDSFSQQLFGWLAAAASLPAVWWCGLPLYRSAWAHLKLKRINLDANATAVIWIGWIASCWQLFQAGDNYYFDAVTMFIAFLLFGRFLAQEARLRASAGLDALHYILPRHARRHDGTWWLPKNYSLMTVCVPVGERIPTDGVALAAATIDEAVLTGEARPVAVAKHSHVWAGTVVQQGLRYRVGAVPKHSRMGQLLDSLENGAVGQHWQTWTDVQRWFGLVVAISAVGVALLWAQTFVDRHRLNFSSLPMCVGVKCALGICAIRAVVCAARNVITRCGSVRTIFYN